ncbi:MAG: hypothetical protein IPK19_02810 [Chloroflexi bacterium]|nr:hypothetical protein [Chloroflexota bacterium]
MKKGDAPRQRWLALWFAAMILLTSATAAAAVKAQGGAADHPYQVFLSPRDQGDGRDNLIFVDLYNGEERRIALAGSGYTVTPSGVMFFDRSTGRVKLATADGGQIDHPFVQLPPTARRIDWQISENSTLGPTIAWTITSGTDTELTTETWIADLEGSNPRRVFADGPRAGIRAYPIAFSLDGGSLYMDYQPDTIGDITPLRQYAGLFAVDLTTGAAESLPGEPGCFCGAGFGGGWFVRLALAAGGFDVRTFQLHSGGEVNEQRITALTLPEFNQGGGILVSPDGTQAVYVLASIAGLGQTQDQSMIVLVDLFNGRQSPATPTLDGLYRPIGWESDDKILFTDRRGTGTWRFDLASGELKQIAAGMVLGTMGYNSGHD